MTGDRIIVVGDVINDIVVVPRGEVRPDTDTASTIRLRPGGSAANTAVWLGSLAGLFRLDGERWAPHPAGLGLPPGLGAGSLDVHTRLISSSTTSQHPARPIAKARHGRLRVSHAPTATTTASTVD